MFEKILIPTDLSAASENLISLAGSLRNVREIVLLHIVRAGADRERERDAVLRQQVLVADPAIVVRSILAETGDNDIPAVILKTAETEGASLILMGARKGLLSRTLLGHGDSEVLTRSRTHVLVMRFPGQGLFAGHPAPPDTPLFSRVLFPLDFSRPATNALGLIG